jgi:hypothetical protein
VGPVTVPSTNTKPIVSPPFLHGLQWRLVYHGEIPQEVSAPPSDAGPEGSNANENNTDQLTALRGEAMQ